MTDVPTPVSALIAALSQGDEMLTTPLPAAVPHRSDTVRSQEPEAEKITTEPSCAPGDTSGSVRHATQHVSCPETLPSAPARMLLHRILHEWSKKARGGHGSNEI